MKILRKILGFISTIIYICQGILFLYVEWTYLRQSFFQIINPFLHLQVILTLIMMPTFWVLIVITALVILAEFGIDTYIKKKEKTKQKPGMSWKETEIYEKISDFFDEKGVSIPPLFDLFKDRKYDRIYNDEDENQVYEKIIELLKKRGIDVSSVSTLHSIKN